MECAYDNAKSRAVCSKPYGGLSFNPKNSNDTAKDDWNSETMPLLHPR